MGGGQDKRAWTACSPGGGEITRMGGKITRDSLPLGGGQAVQGGKINCYTGRGDRTWGPLHAKRTRFRSSYRARYIQMVKIGINILTNTHEVKLKITFIWNITYTCYNQISMNLAMQGSQLITKWRNIFTNSMLAVSNSLKMYWVKNKSKGIYRAAEIPKYVTSDDLSDAEYYQTKGH